ncbi:MAG TPA: MerR family transcriptional regulator, partial [Baekduia sp.]|nr:MerR family transcriptional regulator [Baekduia sp.]
YAQTDVARLRTILRMQRDEFLPLRVIRQELASGRLDGGEPSVPPPAPDASDPRPRRRPSVSVTGGGALYSLDDVVEDTRAEPRLIAELEEYGVIKGEHRAGTKYYDETEREIIRAVTELARYGVGGRNLRAFRTSADREAALLQQILAPALRSRNVERRKEAVEALENLAAVTTHLKHLLLIRDLRKIVG